MTAVRRHGMDCTLTTGGRGMTLERATDGAAAGLTSVAVSIDGMEAAHDRQRALDGSFRAAVRALENLRAAGIAVSVNTQINAWSWQDLPELLEVLIAQRAHAWQLQLTVPSDAPRIDPSFSCRRISCSKCSRCSRASTRARRRTACACLLATTSAISAPAAATRTGAAYGLLRSGQVVLVLEANGTVKGCPSLPTAEWAGGTIRQNSLRALWERAHPASLHPRSHPR
ncbi:MAG TPA: radical SAM protein [Polyangiaceae bacterium]|nr:radical SAM protein [Polyangiaceae bacterium]